METKKLIFVHIFKTGGTTMHHTLKRRYGRNKFLYDTTYRKERDNGGIFKPIENINIYKPPTYKKYDIIFGHFIYEKYKHLDGVNVTILRDPLKRFISHYSNRVANSKKRRIKPESFEEFCEKCKNIYIHFTGGDVNNFNFIGFTEFYNKSMKIIGDISGFDMTPGEIKNCTKEKVKIKLTNKQIKFFKEKNKKDYDFYNFVFNNFRNKYLIS